MENEYVCEIYIACKTVITIWRKVEKEKEKN